jgi:hypothetical protein
MKAKYWFVMMTFGTEALLPTPLGRTIARYGSDERRGKKVKGGKRSKRSLNRRLETIKCAPLPLEGIDNIKGGDGLPTGMLSVSD